MRVLVIGAGNMGLTYSEGMAASPLLSRHKLRIYDTDPQKIKSLNIDSRFNVFDNLADCNFVNAVGVLVYLLLLKTERV